LIVRPVRPNVGFIVVGFSDGEFADAIVFYFILILIVNGFLMPGNRLPLRDRRIPATDSILQSIARFIFKACAIATALAKAVPATSLSANQWQQFQRAARNMLRRNVLQIRQLFALPIFFMAREIFRSSRWHWGWLLLARLRFSKHPLGIKIV